MSKLQAEASVFLQDERDRKNFTNLYRHMKVVSLLRDLRHAEALNKNQYEDQVRESLSLYQEIKSQLQLKKFDIGWFCDLWGVQNEYMLCESMAKNFKEDPDQFSKVCGQIGNKIAQVSQQVYSQKTYQGFYQSLHHFCHTLQSFKKFKSKLKPSTEVVVNKILYIMALFDQQYIKLSDPIAQNHRSQLIGQLLKFRTQFHSYLH